MLFREVTVSLVRVNRFVKKNVGDRELVPLSLNTLSWQQHLASMFSTDNIYSFCSFSGCQQSVFFTHS